MIAVDLPQGKTIEKDLFDVVVLVNIHHALTTTNFRHKIVPLLELKSFEEGTDTFFIAGHGEKGMLLASMTTAYTFKDGESVEKGVNAYVKVAVEDAIRNGKKIPKHFVVQSCHGGESGQSNLDVGTKGLIKGMPSVVTALAILLAKYGNSTTDVTGYLGAAVSCTALDKTFVLKGDPGVEKIEHELGEAELFKKVRLELQKIKGIYARCNAAAALTEDHFKRSYKLLKERGLILENGVIVQTGKDGAKHLPKDYKIKTKESILGKGRG